jgi:hypothetical protein
VGFDVSVFLGLSFVQALPPYMLINTRGGKGESYNNQ